MDARQTNLAAYTASGNFSPKIQGKIFAHSRNELDLGMDKHFCLDGSPANNYLA